MNKKERQKILKEIIENHEIQTQEELLFHLEKKGVKATQATISRDIRQLKIVKSRHESGKTYYRIYQHQGVSNPKEHLNEMVQELVEKISRVEFMTILHTTVGSADLVATLVDELNFPEVVATMAGTDTLLLIAKDTEDAIKLEEKLKQFM